MDDQAPLSGEACPAPETKVAWLQRPEIYPDQPARIDVVETHMAWVFLTDRYAYKLKKPVRYDVLDLRTLAGRRHNCLEEVRLNRRLARDVYLEVIPLTVDGDGQLHLDRQGRVVDWLIKMRRLPNERMLDVLIARRRISAAEIRQVARTIVGFYQASPPLLIDGEAYRRQLAEDIQLNQAKLADLACGFPGAWVRQLHQAQLTFLAREPELFQRRAAAGRILEGHGDLRPEHICLEPEPVIFDCLEFNRRYRILDAADELGFLAMECERIGAGFVDRILFEIYAELTQDRPPQRLINFYKTFRACLRARLAIRHTQEPHGGNGARWRDLAADYLRLAERYKP